MTFFVFAGWFIVAPLFLLYVPYRVMKGIYHSIIGKMPVHPSYQHLLDEIERDRRHREAMKSIRDGRRRMKVEARAEEKRSKERTAAALSLTAKERKAASKKADRRFEVLVEEVSDHVREEKRKQYELDSKTLAMFDGLDTLENK